VGRATGGRGPLPLIAVAVLMASGAGVTVFNSVTSHGAARPGSVQAIDPAADGSSAHPPGAADNGRSPRRARGSHGHGGTLQVTGAAGRFNVGSPHSPELLRRLYGPLAGTGHPAVAKAGWRPDAAAGASAAPAVPAVPAPTAAGATATPGDPGSPSPARPSSPATPVAPRSPKLITPSAPPLPKGVDVASFQHPGGAPINWPRVAAAGYTFAAIKATEGDYYTNPWYGSDVTEAKAAGLYVTGYHFAIPNVSPGAAQARYAVSHGDYAADGHTLPLELDVEYDPYVGIDHTNECYGLTPAQMVAWIGAFDDEAQRLTGQIPIIYTTADWWDTCTADSTAFGSGPLWVAAYAAASPPLPAGRDDWTFWQYASSGTVPGIAAAGHTDVSYFGGGLVTVVDPGSQRSTPGASVSLQLSSLNAATGQALSFTARGLPPGLAVDAGHQAGRQLPRAGDRHRPDRADRIGQLHVERRDRDRHRRPGARLSRPSGTGTAAATWERGLRRRPRLRGRRDGTAGPVHQAGHDDHAPRPGGERLRPDPLDDLLEMPHVGRPDVQQSVRLPRHRAGADHLGVPADRGPDVRGRGEGAAEQFHVGLGRPAQGGRVHPGREPLDRAGRAEPVHPPLDRGRGQPHQAADGGIAGPRVLDQGRHDPFVDLVQAHVRRPASAVRPSMHVTTSDHGTGSRRGNNRNGPAANRLRGRDRPVPRAQTQATTPAGEPRQRAGR
jgi:GH25 family lysozyme M1 (1,4-beta-N-acetylmuramidase)